MTYNATYIPMILNGIYLRFGMICIMGMITWGCQSDFGPSEEKKRKEIREIFAHYKTFIDPQIVESTYESHKKAEDEDERIAHFINYTVYKNYNNHQHIIEKMDSLTRRAQFEKLHELNKFYVFFYLSNRYFYLNEYSKSIDYNDKARGFIEEDILYYNYENRKLQDVLKTMSESIFGTSESYLAFRQKNLKEAIAKGYKREMIKEHFNIALVYLDINQYEKTISHINELLQIDTGIGKSYAAMDNFQILSYAYAGLHQPDSIQKIRKQVDTFYNNHLISPIEYAYYKSAYVDAMLSFEKPETLQKELDDILITITDDCDNIYQYNIASQVQRKLFQKTNNLPAEKKIILEIIENNNRCQANGIFYTNEAIHNYKRLMEIELSLGNNTLFKKWHQKYERLQQHQKRDSEFMVKLTQNMYEKDVSLSNKDFQDQKNTVHQSKRSNMVYALLLIIFCVLAIVFYAVYNKNVKVKLRLKNSLQQLKHQNRLISDQNEQKQKLIGALRESNEKLKNFAQITAHDVKSPIATIHSALQYFSHKYKEQIEAKDLQSIEELHRNTKELSQRINELLTHSQSKNSFPTKQ